MDSSGNINIEYLRSGRTVAAQGASPSLSHAPHRCESPSTSARLESFHNKTQEAVRAAIDSEVVSSDFKIAKCPPQSIVNTDFLRSGLEFAPNKRGEPEIEGTSPSNRLQKYYEATQAAVERVVATEGVSSDFKIAKCEPKTIVNTSFLCSGKEFVSAGGCFEPQRERTSSMNERLQRFYDQTQAAVAQAVQFESVSPDFKIAKCEPKSVINIDYLRSGREFTPSPVHGDDGTQKQTHTMHERLEKYYDTTQAAVSQAVAAEAVSPDFKIAKCELKTIVNVDFLRSGGEFSPKLPRKSSPSAHVVPHHAPGSPARLEQFHSQTAAAMEAAVRAGLVAK